MPRRGDREFLLDILEACGRIEGFVKGVSYEDFINDIKTQDAILRNIEIIGEAVKNLSNEFKNKHTEIEWKKISGMRDKLIHLYFGVNLEIVWDVVKNKIPILKDQISEPLSELECSEGKFG
ncbi:MAG: DUF86 domain-containing protein [Candidatus Zixiibacteriota bacterium]